MIMWSCIRISMHKSVVRVVGGILCLQDVNVTDVCIVVL